ncbi:MAG: hypothetical protein NTV34_07395 [Proteobacteria bacterium]|nr:hypothetical protein [Pseudomonadota bacterium]
MKKAIIVFALGLVSCGQAPSFVDAQGGLSQKRDVKSSDQASKSGGAGTSDPIPADPEKGSGTVDSGQRSDPGTSSPTGGSSQPSGPSVTTTSSTPVVPVVVPSTTTFSSNPTTPGAPTFVVPGVTPDETDQIRRCVMKWGQVPFVGTVSNIRRIYAAVTVGGFGNAVTDTQQTSSPSLVLIDAGVNVFGHPTYDLLNQNAYYCVKVNVNVATTLDVNLACNARLADTSVQVNVGSNVNGGTAVVGVNVGSTVTVSF